MSWKDEQVKKDYEEYKEKGRIWGQIKPERISKIKFPRIPKEIIDGFLAIPDMTSTVSDVLDSLGVRGTVSASVISPVIPGKKIAGTAVTLRNIPERKSVYKGYCNHDPIGMTTRDVQYLAEPGDVLIIDNGGLLDVSNMGGQTCGVTVHCKIAASIVNGAVRDIETIKRLDHPVWAKGCTPITGKYRIEAIEINGPVTLFDIQIQPGDMILADDGGICAVPAEMVSKVLAEVQRIESIESRAEKALFADAGMDEIKKIHLERYN